MALGSSGLSAFRAATHTAFNFSPRHGVPRHAGKGEVLNEESLELRDNNLVYEVPELGEAPADLYTLCGSLVEHYKQESVSFHLHMVFLDRNGTDRKFCSVIARSERALHRDAANRADELSARCMGTENCQQDSPVLVDVTEVIDDSNGCPITLCPVMVRLQSLDLCHRIWGNPVKPMP